MSDDYEEGHDDGYEDGYFEGVIDGHTDLLEPFKTLLAEFVDLTDSEDVAATNALKEARKTIKLIDHSFDPEGD